VANSYALDRNSHIVGCGYYTASGDPSAGIFRIQNDGHLQWFLQVEPDATKSNKCYGIHYNGDYDWSYALFQTTSTSLSFGTYYDTSIVVFDNIGTLKKGVMLSLGADIKYNSKTENQFMFSLEDGKYFVFGGTTTGFSTSFQTTTFENSKTNVFIMKYQMEDKPNQYKCLDENEIDKSDARTSNTIQLLKSSAAYSFYSNLKISTQTNVFAMYSSPYSGAFSLLDTMHIPTPCAYVSQNLTQFDYFYGQWVDEYDIKEEAGADRIVSSMGESYEYVFQNGTNVSEIALFTKKNATVRLQTNDENMVGTQRTVIRACDSLNRLIELNLYLNISDNQAPEFIDDL